MKSELWNVRRWLCSLQRMVRPFLAAVVVHPSTPPLSAQMRALLCGIQAEPEYANRRYLGRANGRSISCSAVAQCPLCSHGTSADARSTQQQKSWIGPYVCERPNDPSSATRRKGGVN